MADEERIARIHLDAIGGLAGDMFVAALIDAFPELEPGLLDALRSLPLPAGVAVELSECRDGAIVGRRFAVKLPTEHHGDHAHGSAAHDGHDQASRGAEHHHRSHREIRRWIGDAGLSPGVRRHALDLFAILAEAEGAIHGVSPEDVAFHEVGAYDSIVDFVAAAYLIEAVRPTSWTWSPLPLGGGRISTAHGTLPVPAPATTLLLKGMTVIDDGVQGERVTPTGAALLRHLSRLNAETEWERKPEIVAATGFGFGSRTLPGLPNATRCIGFAAATDRPELLHDAIATIHFEIDDQSGEELAVAIDRIRESPGVLEVFQAPLLGKKGRMTTQVQVLAETSALDTIADLCLEETTTLGLRIAHVARRKLHRREVTVSDPPVRVKLAMRPSGRITAKSEMDDLARAEGHTGRARLRRSTQHHAMTAAEGDDRD